MAPSLTVRQYVDELIKLNNTNGELRRTIADEMAIVAADKALHITDQAEMAKLNERQTVVDTAARALNRSLESWEETRVALKASPVDFTAVQALYTKSVMASHEASKTLGDHAAWRDLVVKVQGNDKKPDTRPMVSPVDPPKPDRKGPGKDETKAPKLVPTPAPPVPPVEKKGEKPVQDAKSATPPAQPVDAGLAQVLAAIKATQTSCDQNFTKLSDRIDALTGSDLPEGYAEVLNKYDPSVLDAVLKFTARVQRTKWKSKPRTTRNSDTH